MTEIHESDIDTVLDEFFTINNYTELWKYYDKYKPLLNSQEAIDSLIICLKAPYIPVESRDQNLKNRLHAVLLIGAIGPKAQEAIPVLDIIANNNNEDRLLRSMCADAIKKVSPDEFKSTNTSDEISDYENDIPKDDSLDDSIIIENINIGKSKIAPSLIERLQDSKESTWNRCSCAQSLGKLGKQSIPAIPVLIRILKDESEDRMVRCSCAEALGSIGPDAGKSVPVLIKIVKNYYEETTLRRKCIQALARIGKNAVTAIPALIGLVKNKRESIKIRKASVDALGEMRYLAKDALTRFQTILKTAGPEIEDEILIAAEKIEESIKQNNIPWHAAPISKSKTTRDKISSQF